MMESTDKNLFLHQTSRVLRVEIEYEENGVQVVPIDDRFGRIKKVKIYTHNETLLVESDLSIFNLKPKE